MEISCNNCKCWTTRKNIVKGDGFIHNNIMIISDNPTPTEDTTGKIFSSKYHDLLKEIFNYYDLDLLENVYCTNLVKCRVSNKFDDSKEIIQDCSKLWLHEELKLVKPKFILFLGIKTVKILFDNPNSPHYSARGWKIRTNLLSPNGEETLFKFTHSLYKQYNDIEKCKEFIKDVDKFARFVYFTIHKQNTSKEHFKLEEL